MVQQDLENTRRKLLFSGVTAIISLLFVIIVGEVLTQFFFHPNGLPTPPEPSIIDPYEQNPYIHYTRPYLQVHLPGARYRVSRSSYEIEYTINSQGFRGPEIPPKGDRGKHRLLIIGDSIVEGLGVEFNETFAYRIADGLDQQGWEIINLGMQRASPIYYAANLPRYLAFVPDAILILIFENDLFDDRVTEADYFSLPFLDIQLENLSDSDEGSLCLQSHLCRLLKRITGKYHRSEIEEVIARNTKIDLLNKEQETVNSVAQWLVAPSMIDRQWSLSQAYLDFAVDLLQQHDVHILVMSLCLGTIGPGQHEFYHTHCRQLDWKVESWAAERNLSFLSLLPVISGAFEAYNPLEIMLENDGHPTKMLHGQLADYIQPWLITHLTSERYH